ncbi:MAG: FAD-dependent thymidylate synthase [Spirochaetes bacterium GWD1_61_31]|nr:MAG: FAD-dependent thymidylate synthase [Spirochaetes bacterium GWB1_60_80]OHD32836.1 MAG: FAD-dependent thymidylate synthase [Spirochaetes bacterium GWC1_61_12]OHD35079.1 MAG: FAD-dependent thymidylate synthase [Spirochaetes bacterium GWD1_61_31]OHD42755.1 MAG: FAD-dependent thymidylate synthase [Spirochaetes bacterium GWE1_60_18]OHD58607.1 MAG: FAD-dependent thymidylate synthase [Spirochaetes bacterium GWF1_60_12]HAP44443.1 FAD-dependent thymidylate synthase [Spirochaetaceae bacterium]
MAHCIVAAADALLDKEFKVHQKGFVRLVDYLGGDDRIVQAARVSYGEGTKTIREDAALIDYLLRNEHTSPFEQVILTFHIKMPVFVARQWIRHRTARLNEISGRYSVMKDEFWLPEPDVVCRQSRDNKQGRETEPVEPAEAQAVIDSLAAGQKEAYTAYRTLVDGGIARELARVNLPLSLYTEWYWQMDLHNLFRFIILRTDAHAQREIRDYANVILDIVRAVAPLACLSLERHFLGGCRLSADELAALRAMLAGTAPQLEGKQLQHLRAKLAGSC